jgi:2-iminobutanoate/2-iminopropanoate deaminase
MDQVSTFGPYSPIRQVGDLYFISGQVGVDPDTKAAAAGIQAQMRQVLANLTRVLASAGLTPNHIVKTTIFLTNLDDFATVNDIYVDYFTEPRPARSCVGVAELPRVGGENAIQIEIEAVAHATMPAH